MALAVVWHRSQEGLSKVLQKHAKHIKEKMKCSVHDVVPGFVFFLLLFFPSLATFTEPVSFRALFVWVDFKFVFREFPLCLGAPAGGALNDQVTFFERGQFQD